MALVGSFRFVLCLDFLFGLVALLAEESERGSTTLLLVVHLLVTIVVVHVRQFT